jgi:plastocyanin
MSGMSASSPHSAGAMQAGMGHMIMIKSFAFTTPMSVKAGSTVTVMNEDSETHTVTADSGNAFDVTAPPGKTVTFTAPSRPGTYPFHCSYHSEMHGTLHVR